MTFVSRKIMQGKSRGSFLLFVVIFLAIVTTILVTLIPLSQRKNEIVKDVVRSDQAYYTAESGVERLRYWVKTQYATGNGDQLDTGGYPQNNTSATDTFPTAIRGGWDANSLTNNGSQVQYDVDGSAGKVGIGLGGSEQNTDRTIQK